jgi:hypothetical protein
MPTPSPHRHDAVELLGERADECDAIEAFLADALPKSR